MKILQVAIFLVLAVVLVQCKKKSHRQQHNEQHAESSQMNSGMSMSSRTECKDGVCKRVCEVNGKEVACSDGPNPEGAPIASSMYQRRDCVDGVCKDVCCINEVCKPCPKEGAKGQQSQQQPQQQQQQQGPQGRPIAPASEWESPPFVPPPQPVAAPAPVWNPKPLRPWKWPKPASSVSTGTWTSVGGGADGGVGGGADSWSSGWGSFGGGFGRTSCAFLWQCPRGHECQFGGCVESPNKKRKHIPGISCVFDDACTRDSRNAGYRCESTLMTCVKP